MSDGLIESGKRRIFVQKEEPTFIEAAPMSRERRVYYETKY